MKLYGELSNLEIGSLPKISKVSVEGVDCYLKKNDDEKFFQNKLLFIAQKFLSDVLFIKILAPTVNTKKNSEHEAVKMNILKEKGVNVPKIFYSCPKYFILEDCGERLKDFVKREDVLDKEHYLKKAIKSIAELHNLGFAHGGSQIRNFTVKNDEVYMIDFEEVIADKYLHHIQFRDVLIFLISIATLDFKIDYLSILKHYEKHTISQKEMINKIIKLITKMKFLGFLYRKGLSRCLGRDVYEISKLVHSLNYQGI